MAARNSSNDSSGDHNPTDGRRLRREHGRLVTLDATIDLILAGISPPTVEQIASEAGVSVACLLVCAWLRSSTRAAEPEKKDDKAKK